MSYYTTFKTQKELNDYLITIDHPQCLTVNYKPDTDEYALWIGNQPYYVYEEWIEELEGKLLTMKKRNRKLKDDYDELRERVEVIQNVVGFKL